MIATNLRILAVVLVTIGFYTALANMIPQVESDVPREFALGPESSVDDLIVYGEELFTGVGACTTCHGLGTRAPNLTSDYNGEGPIGARCGRRKPSMSCRDYIHESLTHPNDFVVEGFPPIMPEATRTLSEPQILALVAFLENQGGEVTITIPEVMAASQSGAGAAGGGAGAAGGGAAAAGGGPSLAATEPIEILRTLCMPCHQVRDEGNAVGPALTQVGARLSADRIRHKILMPASEPAAGFEALAGIMPATFGNQLTAAQLEAVVNYLSQLR